MDALSLEERCRAARRANARRPGGRPLFGDLLGALREVLVVQHRLDARAMDLQLRGCPRKPRR